MSKSILYKSRLLKSLLLLGLVFSLSACIYKMDIHQGNVVDADRMDKLEIGMSRRQVVDLLGSPQVLDPFHTQRWDYLSLDRTNNQRHTTRSILTLLFEGDKLSEIRLPAPPEKKKDDGKLLW